MLPVTVEIIPHQVTKAVDFLVVDYPSAYNVIIDRSILNKMKVITSTYHLLMCFPTKEGIREVRGDQTVARECYMTSLKGKKLKEALIIDDSKDREDVLLKQTRPADNLEELNIDPNKLERVIQVRKMLSQELKLRLQKLQMTYKNAFTWTQVNMLGINPKVITHRLSVDLSARLIR